MNWGWTVITTILATLFLASIGFIIRFILRIILRPKIEIKYTIEQIEVPKSKQNSVPPKMFDKFGNFSVWIKSSETIHINKITFKRLCMYQDSCLLFDFFSKVGDIQNKVWCPIANVDTLRSECNGLETPSKQEEEIIRQAMHHTGEFSYKPTNKTLQKGIWINIDAPFHLLKEIYHIVQISLHYEVDISYRSRGIHFLNDFAKNVYRIQNIPQFSTIKKLGINFNKKDKVVANTSLDNKEKQQPSESIYIGTAYDGIKKIQECDKLISLLQGYINSFLVKHKPYEVVEISTQELRNIMREKIPSINNINFTQPPNGKYRTLPKEAFEDLLPCLSITSDFCKKFLNCANFAQLYSYSVQYFPLLPYLLKDSYSYLLVSKHNILVDILINLKLRERSFILTVFNTIKTELAFTFKFRKIKSELRKSHRKLIGNYIRMRDKKSSP